MRNFEPCYIRHLNQRMAVCSKLTNSPLTISTQTQYLQRDRIFTLTSQQFWALLRNLKCYCNQQMFLVIAIRIYLAQCRSRDSIKCILMLPRETDITLDCNTH